MQKIEVEGIVVFENLLASLVFQKINFYCLQRLRQSLGDIYIYIYIYCLKEAVILSFKNCFSDYVLN